VAFAPCRRHSTKKSFKAKVVIAQPTTLSQPRPDRVYDREISHGIICLDDLDLDDLVRYIESREARKDYLRWLHLLNAAFLCLREEKAIASALHRDMAKDAGRHWPDAVFAQGLKLWRSGNKWQWPQEKSNGIKTLIKILDRLEDVAPVIQAIGNHEGLLRGGLKANGDIFVVDGHDERLADIGAGVILPWARERLFSGSRAQKPSTERMIEWSLIDLPGEISLVRDEAAIASMAEKFTQPVETEVWRKNGGHQKEIRPCPSAPRGLKSPQNKAALEALGHAATDIGSVIEPMLEGKRPDLILSMLSEAYSSYKIVERTRVSMPGFRGYFGVAHARDYRGMPRAWLIGVDIDIQAFSMRMGFKSELRRHAGDLYNRPLSVMERAERNAPGISLFGHQLTMRNPLHRVYVDGLHCSFESGPQITAAQGIEPEPAPGEISWRGVLAKSILPSTKSWPYAQDLEKLRQAGQEQIFTVGSPDLDRICDLILNFE
jgi:hypothetical protein